MSPTPTAAQPNQVVGNQQQPLRHPVLNVLPEMDQRPGGNQMGQMNNLQQQQPLQPQQQGMLVRTSTELVRSQQVRGNGPNNNPALPQNQQGHQLLNTLLQTLRSPSTPEQQQQVLQILKSNPQLMIAFIRHRQQQQAANATQQGVQQGVNR